MTKERQIVEIKRAVMEYLDKQKEFNSVQFEDIHEFLRVNKKRLEEILEDLVSEELIEWGYLLGDETYCGAIHITEKGYNLINDKEAFEKRFGSAMETENEPLMGAIKIFISSVYKEFRLDREELAVFIGDTFHCKVNISESDKCPDHRSPKEKLKKEIESSDIYLLILGREFGSLCKDGKSITEWEYDTAKAAGIPVLALKKKTRPSEIDKKQAVFIKKVRDFHSGHHVPEFTNSEEIKEKFSNAIAKIIVDSVKDQLKKGKTNNRHSD